jgi:hypothetical protein
MTNIIHITPRTHPHHDAKTLYDPAHWLFLMCLFTLYVILPKNMIASGRLRGANYSGEQKDNEGYLQIHLTKRQNLYRSRPYRHPQLLWKCQQQAHRKRLY